MEAAADAELRLGQADRALAYLEQPAALHPLRESIAALRMPALSRVGRQTDALAVSLAPQVGVLQPRREPLGVAGERLFPVPPLALPSAAAEDSPAAVLDTGAVRLFAEGAAAADPGSRSPTGQGRVAPGTRCRGRRGSRDQPEQPFIARPYSPKRWQPGRRPPAPGPGTGVPLRRRLPAR